MRQIGSDGPVLADAHDVSPAERETDPAAGMLHGPREVDVVDHLAPDHLQAAGSGEGVPPDEHAAPRACRQLPARVVRQPHRVQEVEEEQERRDQQSFGRRHATEPCHAAVEVELPRDALGHEPTHGARCMTDVGIGEEEVRRRHGTARNLTAPLLHRPDLPDPAGRERLAFDDGQPPASAPQPSGGLGRAVARPIVDDDHLPRARVVLSEQAGQRRGEDVLLVVRRHDDGHVRPDVRLPRSGNVLGDRPQVPRARRAQEHGQPRRGRGAAEAEKRQGHCVGTLPHRAARAS